ncbi:unnamed protein product [Clavelina lepadiformis]|uniref:Uncharacterized protein n=1 Tax=Clavelina lepadiformis TaxID=159417 RepID=A0ABP0F8X0_CLALP
MIGLLGKTVPLPWLRQTFHIRRTKKDVSKFREKYRVCESMTLRGSGTHGHHYGHGIVDSESSKNRGTSAIP